MFNGNRDFPGDPAVKTSSSSAGGKGLIPHAVEQPRKQNMKQMQYCNKFNKDFKNGPQQKIKKRENISNQS